MGNYYDIDKFNGKLNCVINAKIDGQSSVMRTYDVSLPRQQLGNLDIHNSLWSQIITM